MSNSRLVYSTEHGSLCPDCEKPRKECCCFRKKREAVPQSGGAVRLRYETAGRKGKGVTLISGLTLSQEQLEDLAKRLKQQLGTGGSVKEYCIELQGDHRKKAGLALQKMGLYRPIKT